MEADKNSTAKPVAKRKLFKPPCTLNISFSSDDSPEKVEEKTSAFAKAYPSKLPSFSSTLKFGSSNKKSTASVSTFPKKGEGTTKGDNIKTSKTRNLKKHKNSGKENVPEHNFKKKKRKVLPARSLTDQEYDEIFQAVLERSKTFNSNDGSSSVRDNKHKKSDSDDSDKNTSTESENKENVISKEKPLESQGESESLDESSEGFLSASETDTSLDSTESSCKKKKKKRRSKWTRNENIKKLLQVVQPWTRECDTAKSEANSANSSVMDSSFESETVDTEVIESSEHVPLDKEILSKVSDYTVRNETNSVVDNKHVDNLNMNNKNIDELVIEVIEIDIDNEKYIEGNEHNSTVNILTVTKSGRLCWRDVRKRFYHHFPKKFKSRKEYLLWLMKERNVGTWVQCCNQSCKKWRYVDDIKDPSDVPEEWFCHMNPDEEHNSCTDGPQEEIPDNDPDGDFDIIYNTYTAGSIVWAKMSGYPWWPAMVDDEVDTEYFYWLDNEESKVPSFYNVVFFDDKVSRQWISTDNLKKYRSGFQFGSEFKTVCGGVDYRDRIQRAMNEADIALSMSNAERLKNYSFLSRYHGPIRQPVEPDSSTDETDSENVKPVGPRKRKLVQKQKIKTRSTRSNTVNVIDNSYKRKYKKRKNRSTNHDTSESTNSNSNNSCVELNQLVCSIKGNETGNLDINTTGDEIIEPNENLQEYSTNKCVELNQLTDSTEGYEGNVDLDIVANEVIIEANEFSEGSVDIFERTNVEEITNNSDIINEISLPIINEELLTDQENNLNEVINELNLLSCSEEINSNSNENKENEIPSSEPRNTSNVIVIMNEDVEVDYNEIIRRNESAYQGNVQPAYQGTVQPAYQETIRPAYQETIQPAFQGTVQPANQGTVQPDNQGTVQPDNQGTVQPDNQGTVQPANQGTVQLANQGTVQLANQGTVQSANQGTVQSAYQGTIQKNKSEE